MDALFVAVGFLTRLPVPARAFANERARTESLAWYPLVGLLLGGMLAGGAWLLRDLPPLLSAALLLPAWVLLTGALHLDGLADSADAWVGGLGDRERTLEIMKDPRSGPAGVVSVVLLLLLKFAALASLPPQAWMLLLLPPLLARAALTAAFVTTPYVRTGGLGAALAEAPRTACAVALLVAGAFALTFGQAGLIALITATAVMTVWRQACLRRLGGVTGDTAGALCELIEAAVLLAAVVVGLYGLDAGEGLALPLRGGGP